MVEKPDFGIWAVVGEWITRWRGDSEDEEKHNSEETLIEQMEYDPERIGGRTDIQAELGMVPAEFVRRILEAEGGRFRQRDFDKYGAFSPSVICRMLQELEEKGVVERHRIGREKIVTLPENQAQSVGRPDSITKSGRRELASTD